MIPCVQVEYDLSYSGGDYHDCGEFAYIPLDQVTDQDVESAFEKFTGHDRMHIIHYCPDEVYNQDGYLLAEDDEDE